MSETQTPFIRHDYDLTPNEKALADEIDERDRVIEMLTREINAALGYMLNAKIDLETGAPKRTALMTLSGGIKRVRAAIKADAP